MSKKLSKKLSKAILQALEDLELVKGDPRYRINFEDWHQIRKVGQFSSSICEVCFAGSVMAKRLNADFTINMIPEDFGKNCRMLFALDYIRQGHVDAAIKCIKKGDFKLGLDQHIDQEDYETFVSQMKEISKNLKELGY